MRRTPNLNVTYLLSRPTSSQSLSRWGSALKSIIPQTRPLSLFMTSYLLQPNALSRAILGASTMLWSIRLYIQWFVFDRSLWRINAFNRQVQYLLTSFWAYSTAVSGIAFWRMLG